MGNIFYKFSQKANWNEIRAACDIFLSKYKIFILVLFPCEYKYVFVVILPCGHDLDKLIVIKYLVRVLATYNDVFVVQKS